MSRKPHVPVQHARTRVLDNELARVGAREPVETSDVVLLGLMDLAADIDLVVDSVAPLALAAKLPAAQDVSRNRPADVRAGDLVSTVLPAGDVETPDGDRGATVLPFDATASGVVRPLVRRRQTWSVVTAAGVAASFVAAGLLSTSSHPRVSSPSLSAVAETKALLAHATSILPSAKATNAAHVSYAKLLDADLVHAASLLPQVQDPHAHASLADQLAALQRQAPPPAAAPPPTAAAHPSTTPSGAAQHSAGAGRSGASAPGAGPAATTARPPAHQTVVSSGTAQRPPTQPQPSKPAGAQPVAPAQQSPAGGPNGAGTGAQQPPPPAGQQPPGEQLP